MPNNNHPLRWRSALDLVATVSMIVVAVTLLVNGRVLRTGVVEPTRSTTIKIPSEPLALDGLATKGDLLAPAGLIIYSDFECPFCRRFALDVLPIIQRDLIDGGRLLLAFGHLPLESIHPHALAAATLAECSRRNGDFWKTHDTLFSTSPLSTAAIAALAEQMGFAEDSTCLTSGGKALVRQQQRGAESLGITGTPAFLLGTIQADRRLRVKRALIGLQSAEAIASAVRAVEASAK